MSNLSLSLWHQERIQEAENLETKVIETSIRVLGRDHPDTLDAMGLLATKLWDQERWAEAEILDTQVVESRTRVLGGEHPDTLNSMEKLGTTYRSQGRILEAEELEAKVRSAEAKLDGSYSAAADDDEWNSTDSEKSDDGVNMDDRVTSSE